METISDVPWHEELTGRPFFLPFSSLYYQLIRIKIAKMRLANYLTPVSARLEALAWIKEHCPLGEIVMFGKSLWTVALCLILGTSLTIAQEKKSGRPKGQPKRFGPAQLFERYDRNKDGFLDKKEIPPRMQPRFSKMDINSDGKISQAELQKTTGLFGNRGGGSADVLFRRLDTNKDGKLSKEELQKAPQLLQKLDRNKDGMIDLRELRPRTKRSVRPGEVNTPPARGERGKTNLNVGDAAPDFTLPDLSGKKEIALSGFRGKKPVVLIFASYT